MSSLAASFVHAPLLWGLLVVLAPLIIHLINLLRQRRVQWAAMDFLLRGRRRRKRWVVLRQWLLLAARMAAIAAAALLFAEPVLRDDWMGALSGGAHHIVLLDDTLSMSQRDGNGDVFETAQQAVAQLVQRLAGQSGRQSLTLLRFSRTGGEAVEPDLLKQVVAQTTPAELEQRVAAWSPSFSHRRPEQAFAAIEQLLGSGAETRIVYIVSDFRAGDWNENDALDAAIERVATAGAQVRLVRCASEGRPNLAVTDVQPATGVLAAQTPAPISVEAANFSETPAQNVAVQIIEDSQTRPALLFEEIPADAAASKQYATAFAAAGQRLVTAAASGDALPGDDVFYRVLDVADRVPVLLVSDDAQDPGVRFVATALAPGGATNTGLSVRVEPPRALQTLDLEEFAGVLLIGVARLQESEAARLEQYVAAGGGMAVFVDESTDVDAYNEFLFRDGTGLAAASLGRPTDLLVNRLRPAPDVAPTDHPLFQILAGDRNPFAANVVVQRYFSVRDDWSPANVPGVRVAARLRNGAPIVLEKTYGEGRSLQFLTTAGPQWNNWGRADPSFVVVMLELASQLAAGGSAASSGVVGSPMAIRRPAAEFEDQAVVVPVDGESAESEVLAGRVEGDEVVFDYAAATPGFYQLRLPRKEGAREESIVAFNVDVAESRLALADPAETDERWEGAAVQWIDAAAGAAAFESENAAGEASAPLIALLAALAVSEVMLAYACGFHAASRREGAA